MLRRSVGAMLVLFVLGTFVLADTVRGVITKTDLKDGVGTITVNVRKDRKDKEGTDKTFKITSKTKFYRGGGKDKEAKQIKDYDGDKLAAAVTKAAKAEKGPKGIRASLDVDGEDVTKITIAGGGRGKKTKGKEKKTDE